LSVTKRAEAMGVARGTVYHLPRPVPAAGPGLMRQLDEPHLEFPFAKARMLRGLLAARGQDRPPACQNADEPDGGSRHSAGGRARRNRSPDTRSIPIRRAGLEIVRPNQVWAMDIACIPMAKGFVYLAACCRGACPSRWRLRFAWRRWKKRLPGMGSRRSSIQIGAPGSQARPSRTCSPGGFGGR
jgi:hypothetical protein